MATTRGTGVKSLTGNNAGAVRAKCEQMGEGNVMIPRTCHQVVFCVMVPATIDIADSPFSAALEVSHHYEVALPPNNGQASLIRESISPTAGPNLKNSDRCAHSARSCLSGRDTAVSGLVDLAPYALRAVHGHVSRRSTALNRLRIPNGGAARCGRRRRRRRRPIGSPANA